MGPGRRSGAKIAMALAPPALFLGFALGAAAYYQGGPLAALDGFLAPIGKLWTNALQVSVFPLVLSLLIVGIASLPSGKAVGKWSWVTLATFAGMLILASLFVATLASIYLPAFGPARLDPATLEFGGDMPQNVKLTFADWIEGLIPRNLVEAMVKGDMLPIVICGILFGFAVRSIEPVSKSRLLEVVQAVRDAVLVYVRWVLLLIPLGAFALAFSFSAKSGWAVAGATFHYFVYSSTIVLLYTGFLYVLVLLVGRVSPIRFARAVFPAQSVAVGTRSSLAALPSTVDGAKDLGLPGPASDFVLPLAVSVFKQNRTVTSPAKLLFLSTMFGVAVGPRASRRAGLMVMLLSVSTPAIPSLGTNATFGAYISLGMPPVGVVLFEAVEPLMDIFKTLCNVTANLAAATISSRFCGSTVSELATGELAVEAG